MAVPLLATLAGILARGGEQVLASAAEAVRQAEQADRVSVVSFADGRFTVVAHAGRGLLGRDATLLLDTSSHFATAAGGREFHADDFADAPAFRRPVDQLVVTSGFRSGAAVPMWVGDRPVGAIAVSCADFTVPAAQRLPRLEGVAAMMALHLAASPAPAVDRVLVCSERSLVGYGVVRLLESEGCTAQVATSHDEAVALAAEGAAVSLVVADPYLAGTPADRLMARVRRTQPAARLAVLSEHDDADVRAQAAAMGGALLAGRPAELRSGVRDLLAGRGGPEPAVPSAGAVDLTRRERDVLATIERGRTVHECARDLGLRDATVKGYLRSLFGKLDVHSRTEAVHRARLLGLLDSTVSHPPGS